MSVPAGTLTDVNRTELLGFYGRHFGWREVESLRLSDRLTIAVGAGTYINLRERPEGMTTSGYEHFGLLVGSPEDVERLFEVLSEDEREVQLEPLTRGDDGYRSFRFRYLMPFAVEVQFLPPAANIDSLP